MPGKEYCPVPGPLEGPGFPISELEPLLEQLRSPEPVAGRYPVGTLSPDDRLDLCKQSLGLQGVRRLPASPAVSSLLLGTNGLGDAGAVEVARLLRDNQQLSTLYLGCNYIGQPGMQSLAEALGEIHFSGSLWLKRNPLGLEGSQALAQALGRGFAPVCLDLEQCELGNDGAGLVLQALLDSGCAIRRLSLAGNHLGPELLPQLNRFLKECPSLQALQLGANRLAGLEPSALRELGLASNGVGDQDLPALLAGELQELDLGVARTAALLQVEPNRLSQQGLTLLAGGSWQRLLLDPLDLDRIPLPSGVFRCAQPPMWYRARRQNEDPLLTAVRSRYRTVR